MHTVKFLRTLVPEPEVCPKSQVSSGHENALFLSPLSFKNLPSNDLSVFGLFWEHFVSRLGFHCTCDPPREGSLHASETRLPPGLRTVAQMLSIESSKLKLSSLIITLADYIDKGKENATGTALSIGH
ncbi:Type 2 Lactosamine Alpha-2,3-Sialyltransferase [Manis pentadactyla]|nr:Type 2 Lactosamine Alpha-2,3-Sialyltransferase [Manis pentadactyla]